MADNVPARPLLAVVALALTVACGTAQTSAPTAAPAKPAATTPPPAAATGASPQSAAPASPAASPQAGSTQALANGSFVKAPDQPTIFVIQNGQKRAFSDMETFVAWGGRADGSNVVQVPQAQLDAIPTGDAIPPGSRP